MGADSRKKRQIVDEGNAVVFLVKSRRGIFSAAECIICGGGGGGNIFLVAAALLRIIKTAAAVL